MRWLYLMGCLAALCFSCSGKGNDAANGGQTADSTQSVSMLQGVWLDNDTEMPVMKVRGDTIALANRAASAFRFVVSGDTLFAQDTEHTIYYIRQLTEQDFSFYTTFGDTVRLHKAEDEAAWMVDATQAMLQPTEVLKKDSVLTYDGKRYRGYVYVNPSTRKVLVPEVTGEGLVIDNVYYDNVIHVCVYQGKRKMCSRDITRDQFAGVIPDSFLRNAILSDMDFVGVGAGGYFYRAIICSASSHGTSSYYVKVCLNDEGVLNIQLIQ